jgi:hypothetical protein
LLLVTEFCSSTFECNYCKAWDTTQYRLYKVLSESNLMQAWYLTYHSFNVDVVYRFRVVVAVVIDLVFVVDRMALRICLCSGIFKCLCTWVLPGHLRSSYIHRYHKASSGIFFLPSAACSGALYSFLML